MHPSGGDVLEVVMADMRGELGDTSGQVFRNAVRVSDIEVQADRGGVKALGNLEILMVVSRSSPG